MGATRFGPGAGKRDTSWADETLPLTVRRELLARELEKLGFGRARADVGDAGTGRQQQQQQQPQAQAQAPVPERPQRDAAAAQRAG